ncbi:MAG: hypothetical protein KGH93_02035 [Patescibacteria group bacterium]|nr:hypothetical protein [Patescibacteria group bacterium]MDE1945958.1 hypothetical protein [Patescibacteria group bacterium]
MKKSIITISVLAGIALVALAVFYWMTPAGNLPHLMPGFESGVTKVHFKHGLASLLLGLALFAYAWFASGSKSANG